MLTDTHCHLTLAEFDPDRGAVLDRAIRAGVERILIPGLTLSSSLAAVKLAEGHPNLYAAIGIHPTEVSNVEGSTWNSLRELAQNPRVKAIGEIGLDYYWDAAPHDRQQEVLKEQLSLAAESKLPVVIHFREKGNTSAGECASDLMKILEQWVSGLGSGASSLAERPGVLHSFSGTLEMAQVAMSLGFYLGVAGPLTFENNRRRQELVAGIPLEHILIETDAPFQTPYPHRGKRNEPAFVRLIADKIASGHSVTIDQVSEVTTANARHLFDWN